MSFSDLFDSGFKKRNQDHFAAIVRVAMDDGTISDGERAFLDRLARKLEISDSMYAKILEDYNSHPINAPHSYDDRLERLYDLTRMVYADDVTDESEISLLRKISVGLGFQTTNVSYIVDKALNLVGAGATLETFVHEIKNMNK